MALHLEDGETFIEGRSPKKAKELLAKAEEADMAGSVRTTSHGYIVPTKLVEGESDADADDTNDDDSGDADADGTADENAGEAFDPASHTAAEVEEYLASADDEERERVLAAERDGKARKSLLSDSEGDK